MHSRAHARCTLERLHESFALSGKTTTSGKLAAWLQKGGHRPMLVSVDVYRPAAREQLKIVAGSIKASLYEGDTKGEAAGSAPQTRA